MKKRICVLLLAAILINLFAGAIVFAEEETLPFEDVLPDDWYYEYVKTVYEAGAMKGKSDSLFDAESPMTRAELVTVLCRLSGETYWGLRDDYEFPDTSSSAWYADYLGWAVTNDIVVGYPDGTFRPDAPVQRQEIAKLLVIFAEHIGLYEDIEPAEPLIAKFTDSASFVGTWSEGYIEEVRATGLMGGDPYGRFLPEEPAARSEIATILTRLIPSVEMNEALNKRWSHKDMLKWFVPYEFTSSEGRELNYRIYVPVNYSPEKEYPVLLFLHGVGECGTNNSSQLSNMIIHMFNQKDSHLRDAIVVCPQSRGGWESDSLIEMLNSAIADYSVDRDRFYVMGLSMGGYGTWRIIADYPEFFAGAVPICGGGDVRAAEKLVDLPIYAVHGVKDDVVPVGLSRQMVKALKEAGSTVVVYEELPDYDHNVWDYAANKPEILDWLFAQSRSDNK